MLTKPRICTESLLSEAALNLAGTKAASADIHLAHSAVYHRVHGLNVGSPCGPGLPVGMAYQIAAHNTLFAYFAVLTHALHLLTDGSVAFSFKQCYFSTAYILLQAKKLLFCILPTCQAFDDGDTIEPLCFAGQNGPKTKLIGAAKEDRFMSAEHKLKLKELAKDLLYDIIGGILYAAGIYSFASSAEFAPGGISGLAIIINHFTSLPIGICTLVLNLPVLFICIKTLGKTFLFKSIKTMIISTLIIDFVFPLLPVYNGDALMAAIFAGALSGAGLALVYWRGSSTGGTDFLILSLRKKFPHLSIGTISICIDGMVILLGGIVFKRIDAVLQGMVMTAVSTTIIDKITAGFMTGQVTFIVTNRGEEISNEIMQHIGRGVTSIKATGMFSGTDRSILMCACSRAEACHVRGITYSIDKSALVLLCPYDTAYGLGFQPPLD